jgi:hypothetical protein
MVSNLNLKKIIKKLIFQDTNDVILTQLTLMCLGTTCENICLLTDMCLK